MQCITCGTTLQPGMNTCPTCGTPASYSQTFDNTNVGAQFIAPSSMPAPSPAADQFPAPISIPDRTMPAAGALAAANTNVGAQFIALSPTLAPTPMPAPSPVPVPSPSTPPPHTYGPPPTAPQPPQSRSRGLVILLAALVALMIIGAGLLYFVSGPYPAMQHASATATAQARVNANATGTAVVIHNQDATATAQAQATLTAQQNIYAQATSGDLVLNDSLAQNTSSRWDLYNSAANAGCVFTGGAYHVIQQQVGYFNPCFANAPTFSNFTFQVQMTILKGDQGGMVFRANNQNFKGYLLVIGSDLSYGLYVYYNSSGKSSQTILSGASPAINGLNQPNLVTLIAQGGHLTLFINKHYVDAISDSTYKSGQIALVAQSQNNATEVAYSNAQVWKF